ncbi:hypothetical protein D623_10003523 [Myotis brandtii]|uniref:Uncharacterized protein n=1 Tax=Myotis brandtii TaxID=109478 RepID=S7P766_MYOBR|nr:hypothetical protein D623_10003523 [Myotis brandtii]
MASSPRIHHSHDIISQDPGHPVVSSFTRMPFTLGSSSRIPHLGSRELQPLYFSCLLGHVAPTAVPIGNQAQHVPSCHCLKNRVGTPSDDTIPTLALLDDVTASLQTWP